MTLIFGLPRYDEVMEAYLSGLEAYAAAGADDLSLGGQRGVVLRESGRHRDRPPARGAGRRRRRATPRSWPCGARPRSPRPRRPTSTSLRTFSGPRWEALAAKGAQVQRPLWASTSTKNPAYPRPPLRGHPDRPRHRQHDARGHARGLRRPRDAWPARSTPTRRRPRDLLGRLDEVGIDLADVGATLEDEGVHSFAKSFDELIQTLTRQGGHASGATRGERRRRRPAGARSCWPATPACGREGNVSANRLGWLEVPRQMADESKELGLLGGRPSSSRP